MRLEHVNMTVSDVDRSAGFYCELLDMAVRWRGQTASGADAAHVGDDRCYLALFQGARGPAVPPDYDGVGLNHFGFVVEDLDDAKRRLAAMGVKPHFEPVYEPGRRVYFYDPDGVEVELVEYDS